MLIRLSITHTFFSVEPLRRNCTRYKQKRIQAVQSGSLVYVCIVNTWLGTVKLLRGSESRWKTAQRTAIPRQHISAKPSFRCFASKQCTVSKCQRTATVIRPTMRPQPPRPQAREPTLQEVNFLVQIHQTCCEVECPHMTSKQEGCMLIHHFQMSEILMTQGPTVYIQDIEKPTPNKVVEETAGR